MVISLTLLIGTWAFAFAPQQDEVYRFVITPEQDSETMTAFLRDVIPRVQNGSFDFDVDGLLTNNLDADVLLGTVARAPTFTSATSWALNVDATRFDIFTTTDELATLLRRIDEAMIIDVQPAITFFPRDFVAAKDSPPFATLMTVADRITAATEDAPYMAHDTLKQSFQQSLILEFTNDDELVSNTADDVSAHQTFTHVSEMDTRAGPRTVLTGTFTGLTAEVTINYPNPFRDTGPRIEIDKTVT